MALDPVVEKRLGTASLICLGKKPLSCNAASQQGCQRVYFKTKNPNLGVFWIAMEWKMLVYFTTIWYNLWPFGVVCGPLFFSVLVCLDQEKSGNPASQWQKVGLRKFCGQTGLSLLIAPLVARTCP
jgi:hypothetical protein